jgi:hypothetical protein
MPLDNPILLGIIIVLMHDMTELRAHIKATLKEASSVVPTTLLVGLDKKTNQMRGVAIACTTKGAFITCQVKDEGASVLFVNDEWIELTDEHSDTILNFG